MPANIIKCQNCTLASACLPVGLSKMDMQQLETSVTKQQTHSKAAFLARSNDRLENLYAVRAGSFKSVKIDNDGNQRILDFHLPGELIGLDCLAGGNFHYDIIALENSSTCDISKEKLFEIASHSKNVQAHMFNLMSQRLSDYQKFNSQAHADERTALFLLAIFTRYKNCGFSKKSFELPMSRNDIGDFLGLAAETVTRILKKFEREKLINIANRIVTITDEAKLHDIANCKRG